MEISYVCVCLQTGAQTPDSHSLWKLLLLRVWAVGERCALGESSIVYVKCLILIFNSEITVLKTHLQTRKRCLLYWPI